MKENKIFTPIIDSSAGLTHTPTFFYKYGIFNDIRNIYRDFVRLGIKVSKFEPINDNKYYLHLNIPFKYEESFFNFKRQFLTYKNIDMAHQIFITIEDLIKLELGNAFIMGFTSILSGWDEENFNTADHEYHLNNDKYITNDVEKSFYDYINNLELGDI